MNAVDCKNILVIRSDRLGDVLLSLPSLVFLKKALPQARLTFACKSIFHPVLSHWALDQGIDLSPLPASLSSSETERFFCHQDAVVFLNSDGKLLAKAKSHRIRLRVGSYSKGTSFFLLTHGLRQKRSSAHQSEGQYGLDLMICLLDALSVPIPPHPPSPLTLTPHPQAREQALSLLAHEPAFQKGPFTIVHPGMGGSALNLSAQNYSSLIQTLRQHMPVFLSIGPYELDRQLGQQLSLLVRDLPILSNQSLEVLMELFRLASLVVAPSTGPLHLAHYVGTATVGLFSPIRTQRPLRWGPWGGSGQAINLTPEIYCPAPKTCFFQRCPHFPCMEKNDWSGKFEAFNTTPLPPAFMDKSPSL